MTTFSINCELHRLCTILLVGWRRDKTGHVFSNKQIEVTEVYLIDSHVLTLAQAGKNGLKLSVLADQCLTATSMNASGQMSQPRCQFSDQIINSTVVRVNILAGDIRNVTRVAVTLTIKHNTLFSLL